MTLLTESEKQTIINSLYTAADTYKDIAARCSAESAEGVVMAAAFSRQHREAIALAEKVERME